MAGGLYNQGGGGGGGAPAAHAPTHENGGSDEVSVVGLSGLLADDQTPLSHALDGAKHTIAGKTDGQKLAATGAASFAFEDDIDQIQASFDGGGSAIVVGSQAVAIAEYACVVVGWTVLALGASGAIVIDVWKDTYANHPPTVADTIAGTEKPTIVATNAKGQDTTLTTWTTVISAGDIIVFNVDSCTSITKAYVSLKVRRT